MDIKKILSYNISLGKMIAATVLSNADPMKFQNQLDEFCQGKEVKNIVINVNQVMAGMQVVNGQPVAQMQAIVSAYIQWFCTKEEYDSFLFKQKTLLTGK